MVCIMREALSSQEYSMFKRVENTKLSKEDIATILDVFEIFLQSSSSDDIESILKDNDGHILFLLTSGSKSNFDLYSFLNSHYSEDCTIDCINAKLLFPRELSKGIYNPSVYNQANDIATTNMEEESTGYIDEDALRSIMSSKVYHLEYVKLGSDITISDNPVSIGRSNKEADFVIQGNTNISRKHCIISTRNGIVYVKDNKSLNGTFINNEKLIPNVEKELHEGDVLYVADEKFVLR